MAGAAMEELALKGMCRNSSQPQKLPGLFPPPSSPQKRGRCCARMGKELLL